ncbi:MAG TPA: acyl-ACP desaturase, partial [Yeosuana sp.]
DEAEKARDYLMKLPERMLRIADRMTIPENSFQFKWVEPAKLKL